MKSMGHYLLSLALLASIAGCGKKNESGRNAFNYNNAYCASGVACNPYTGQIGGINSPIQIANIAQAENPCAGGTFYSNQRIPVQTQLAGLQGNVAAGDVYLGVTSYGDVAVLIGTGANVATLHAYLCPRVANSGQGQITPPTLGAMSPGCNIKPITAMNMIFPDGQRAAFRDPAFGVRDPFTGQKIRNFSFCQQAGF